MCAVTSAGLAEKQRQLIAKGYANPVVAAVIQRTQLHAETEVRWHDEVAKIIAELPDPLALEPPTGTEPSAGGEPQAAADAD